MEILSSPVVFFILEVVAVQKGVTQFFRNKKKYWFYNRNLTDLGRRLGELNFSV